MKRVLLVEDDEQLRNIVASCLRLKNFEVVEAADSIEAEKSLRAHRADLILSDVRMPKGGAREVIRVAAQAAKGGPAIPVILMTGQAEASDAELLVAGAKALIHKPFDMEKLVRMIDKTIQAASGATGK